MDLRGGSDKRNSCNDLTFLMKGARMFFPTRSMLVPIFFNYIRVNKQNVQPHIRNDIIKNIYIFFYSPDFKKWIFSYHHFECRNAQVEFCVESGWRYLSQDLLKDRSKLKGSQWRSKENFSAFCFISQKILRIQIYLNYLNISTQICLIP